MQAIVGCAIEDRPGRWFVQLRIPSDDLFDQRVLSNAWGDTKEEAIEAARAHAGGVQVIPWIRKPRMSPTGLHGVARGVLPAMSGCEEAFDGLIGVLRPPEAPQGVLAAMARCAEAVADLADCISNPHYGI